MTFLRTSMTGDELDNFRFRRAMELLTSVAGTIPASAQWLDLGCNQGQFLEILEKEHGIDGVGFDDWTMKETINFKWRYLTANLDRELPWDAPVDFISALEVLEHMIDTDGFLKRIHAKLKPKGWLVLSTPNINCLRNRITVPMGAYPSGMEYRNIIHHVRMYNVPALNSHLHEHGFRNISVIGVSFLPQSLSLGTGRISSFLADKLPSLCNNVICVAQKP